MCNNNSDGERKMEKYVQVIWECEKGCRRKQNKEKGKVEKLSITLKKSKTSREKVKTSKYFPYSKDALQPSDKLHELHLKLEGKKFFSCYDVFHN